MTATAGLDQDTVKLSDTFEVVDGVEIGRRIENSHDELCGGTFVQAFADSCNTVFAPLGIDIGAEPMLEMSERFGFNQIPQLASKEANEVIDPPEPNYPDDIDNDIDLGVNAIGQGEVLSTPLSMASVAQTIAAGGMRSPTPITKQPGLAPEAKPVQVTDPNTAGIVRNLMVAVVDSGTGTSANLGRIQVAGKTGTAELGEKPFDEQPEAIQNPKPLQPGEEPPEPEQILDAWFTGFAPADKPKVVVCVLLADAEGDGGEVAAPVAREIFAAALG